MYSKIEILGRIKPEYSTILTDEALDFVVELHKRFSPELKQLLQAREERQRAYDAGALPGFLDETTSIRTGDWKVASPPPHLLDRRVEITGPVDRKMIINALNSKAKVFMADFEDSSSSTWEAMMDGQVNLRDAVAGTISYTNEKGKYYSLNKETSILFVRPRGWHMTEDHVVVNGKDNIAAGLWDFGLFFFHNAKQLIAKGHGPYFYLPKMQSHLEARLWNSIFVYAQEALGILQGSIRATVLIETLPAVFEMNEILYELRDHSIGLNCGRWDYIFSFIKCFRNHAHFVLPDRGALTMRAHFLRSYSRLLIDTCHHRGCHALGGMAAQIPVKGDDYANRVATEKVRDDKQRECDDGHDGSWVSHPSYVALCEEIFTLTHGKVNQLDRRIEQEISSEDLLKLPEGKITIKGLMNNISVALRYTASWLQGLGAVPLFNMMEDLATAEIARAQVWQWVRYPEGVLEDGRDIDSVLFREILQHEQHTLMLLLGKKTYQESQYAEAGQLLEKMVITEQLPNFLSLEGYPYIKRCIVVDKHAEKKIEEI